VVGDKSTVGRLSAGSGSGECPSKFGTTPIRARLVDARLRFGLRRFLKGRVGIGCCSWFALGVSSSSSLRLLWLDSMSVACAVDGVLASLLRVCGAA
jgi:hypothetical protein